MRHLIINVRARLLALVVAAVLCSPLLAATAPEHSDTLLSLLVSELQYNFGQLQKQGVKPYFMSYRVEDVYNNVIGSSFGVVQSNEKQRTRSMVPQVRVGSVKLDNFKYDTSGGRSIVVTLPYEDSATDGIATNIWNATLSAYNDALEAYEKAKSKMATSAADEDKSPCFSAAPAEQYVEPGLDFHSQKIDQALWERRLNEVSAVFRADPSLLIGSAVLSYEVGRSYLVNSEGTALAHNHRSARVLLVVQAMADDGMLLPMTSDFFAFNPDSLPSQEVLVAAAKDLLQRVEALKKAPVANPDTGPAILSGPASGVFFHEIFGHRLEGHRLKEGGETFKNMVGKQVLPTSFNVYCDPTLRHFAGTDMNGYYPFDDEGVKARRVVNVENGVLKAFLMSRKPIDGFPESNGHGRADNHSDPVSRQSNLIVENKQPYSDAQLRQMLVKEARRQGKEYGYYFRTVTSGYTMTGEGGSINSFNVTPVEVYRVYVDGRPDELVRGVSLIGTPLSMFSHIQAGGSQTAVFTGSCGAESGWVPVTACSPSIFVSQIETQRSQKSDNVPALLPPPLQASGNKKSVGPGHSDDEVFFAAMNDEMKRSTDSLCMEGCDKPYYVDFSTIRYREYGVTGELGGVSLTEDTPWKTTATGHILLGNYVRTNELPGQENFLSTNAPVQVDYDALRRTFWQISDVGYKEAVVLNAQKLSYLKQNPLPVALTHVPDRQKVEPCTYIATDSLKTQPDIHEMECLARNLSAVFKDYPFLYNTSVKINCELMTTYRLTSDGVRLKVPHNQLTVTMVASFMDSDQVTLGDNLVLPYESWDEMPSADVLKARVKQFADGCMALRGAPAMPEYYRGPVLYTNEAALDCIYNNYISDNSFIANAGTDEDDSSLGQKLGKQVIDPRFSLVNRTDLQSYKGQPVFGHYSVDADGITPAKSMTIVDKGVLKMLLNHAVPAEYALASTGSARFSDDINGDGTVTGFGALCIQAEDCTADKDMIKLLIKTARKQKLPYAYIVDVPQGQVRERVYQVNVKTGETTLMKTNSAQWPSTNEMQHVVAVSDKQSVYNFITPYTYSIIYPTGIIVDNIEMAKPSLKADRIPEIVYPLQRNLK